MVLEKLVEEERLVDEDVLLANAGATRAATVRIEGRNMTRDMRKVSVLKKIEIKTKTYQCRFIYACYSVEVMLLLSFWSEAVILLK